MQLNTQSLFAAIETITVKLAPVLYFFRFPIPAQFQTVAHARTGDGCAKRYKIFNIINMLHVKQRAPQKSASAVMRCGFFCLVGSLWFMATTFVHAADSPQNATKEAVVAQERRVMFDESLDWAESRAATDTILARVQSGGFNVYVPCVWHGRGTLFPSALSKTDTRVANRIESGDDPLAYLITQAHAIGVQVHPWFYVMRREDDKLPAFFDEGTPKDAFNLHQPAFRTFIVNLMLDTVKRYDIDGLNLDYIRSMGFCTSDFCAQDYRSKFDRSLYLDLLLRKIPRNKTESLSQWNFASVSDIVRRFSTEAKRLKPKLEVSMDGHPLGEYDLLQGQDSITWANQGWIDVIYYMQYAPRIDVEKALAARNALREPAKLTLLVSLYDMVQRAPVARDASVISGYVDLARQQLPGTGIAFYHRPRMSDAQWLALKNGPFQKTALFNGLSVETKWATASP